MAIAIPISALSFSPRKSMARSLPARDEAA
jgi:hypothetical protein